jgi:dTDP-4-amino-4,6-dideoxygalactose transaminase
MHIPGWPQADEREAELLREVLASPQWGGFHPFVEEFERSFASFQHAAYAISAANGTLTLELALELCGVGPGDEVIVPAISFISSATAISRRGAVPVFVDIERDSFNISPDRAKIALTPRTKALMAVHFGGTLADLTGLIGICNEAGIPLIEDAAHAQGAEWNGKRAGSFGLMGSFSFQNGKVLTAGEGGALVTSDEKLAARAHSIANCGRVQGHSFYEHHFLGSNFRLTGFQAAVLIAQLEKLPAQNARRAQNAALLKSQLGDVGEITWQREPKEQTENPFYLLLGRLAAGLDNRLFCEELKRQGIPCAPFYPHTLYQNPAYTEAPHRNTGCPVAESSVNDSFWINHRLLLADEPTIELASRYIKQALISARKAYSMLPA